MLPRCSAAFRAAERCCSTTPIAPANGWWARVGGGSIPTSTSACCRRGEARCSASAADSAADRLAQAPVETARYAGDQKCVDQPPRPDVRPQPTAHPRQTPAVLHRPPPPPHPVLPRPTRSTIPEPALDHPRANVSSDE